MCIDQINLFFSKLRSAVSVSAVAGLFCICVSSSASAQRADHKESPYVKIDQEEGVRRMAAFRSQRLEGDYCFRFELEHLPRRGDKKTYLGTMWGSWNEQGPITRFEIFPSENSVEGEAAVVELIVQNGIDPHAWIRHGRSGSFNKITGDALFEPVLPGVVYSPFDLQMPFIYWDSFSYEGPVRVQSRIAQQFLMSPPEASLSDARGIGAVRVCLDDSYDALLRIEVLNGDGDELSRFTVESFKKVQGQYIVKEITLKNYATRDRTRFKVKEASVGQKLQPHFFDPVSACSSPKSFDGIFETL